MEGNAQWRDLQERFVKIFPQTKQITYKRTSKAYFFFAGKYFFSIDATTT